MLKQIIYGVLNVIGLLIDNLIFVALMVNLYYAIFIPEKVVSQKTAIVYIFFLTIYAVIIRSNRKEIKELRKRLSSK